MINLRGMLPFLSYSVLKLVHCSCKNHGSARDNAHKGSSPSIMKDSIFHHPDPTLPAGNNYGQVFLGPDYPFLL